MLTSCHIHLPPPQRATRVRAAGSSWRSERQQRCATELQLLVPQGELQQAQQQLSQVRAGPHHCMGRASAFVFKP
jgi:hypothetical protein